jgi:protease-4
VDELASLWQAGRKIHKELGMKEKFGFTFIKEKKKNKFWKLLENMEEASSHIKEIATSTERAGLYYQVK